MAAQSCHKVATSQLEAPARAGPVGFQAGKGFLPQTQRRGPSNRGKGEFGCSQGGDWEPLPRESMPGEVGRLPSYSRRFQLYRTWKARGELVQKHPRNSGFDPLPLPRGPSRCFPYRRHSRDSSRGSGCFPGWGAFSPARDPLGERLGPGASSGRLLTRAPERDALVVV